ncbi:hypothetical protein ABB02_02038 [Clostridiaceae bacterium JG1575]|nr:hypothetical protein ABB02_02038 [Clostridiaceae bacterium JG1575]
MSRIAKYQQSYRQALETLKNNDDVLAVFVFGSMVSGDLWEKSDIDFFVVVKKWAPGITNVYSNETGERIHYKVLSRKEFMALKGFDLKGSFMHRLFAGSRMVLCRDSAIEERFLTGRGYPDVSRNIWTLAYVGKVIKGTDSVRKSLTMGNVYAAYQTLMDTMNWVAMVLINERGYMVSKDNINIATALDDEFRLVFSQLTDPSPTPLSDRVRRVVDWILESLDRDLMHLSKVLLQYLSEHEEPRSAREIQEDPLFFPYHIEVEAILSLLYENKFLKRSVRSLNTPGGSFLIRENVYSL